jgi:1-acyl-sn-glycerol-3-phosphate acyltransferase
VNRRNRDPWYALVAALLKPALLAFTIKDWRGAENLPRAGGFIVVTNHISHIDPFTFGHFMYDHGYRPRFLAKESVFRIPVFGNVVSGARQIPVHRETADANASYAAAVAAVNRGECVAIYPEGTLTRDPDLWPMRGKTGAARIALATGCPVIPVAQWGVHQLLPPYARRPNLLPRHVSHVWAGPAIDLSAWQGQPIAGAVVTEATDAITAALTRLLEQIRGQQAPGTVWDPREHAQPRIGNPGTGEGR